MSWSGDLPRDISEIVRRALRSGFAEIPEVDEDIFEEVEVKSDEDFRTLIEEDVPNVLKDILRKAGLRCRLFLSTVERMPEYIANCWTRDNKPVALEIDAGFEPWEGEGFEGYGSYQLYSIRAHPGHYGPNMLVYYKEVPPLKPRR